MIKPVIIITIQGNASDLPQFKQELNIDNVIYNIVT